jgi:hypothetical protein
LVISVNHTLGRVCRVLLDDRPYGADLAEVRHLQVENTDDIDGIDLLSGRHGLRHDCVDGSVLDRDRPLVENVLTAQLLTVLGGDPDRGEPVEMPGEDPGDRRRRRSER